MLKPVILFVFLFISALTSFAQNQTPAQTRADLEKERASIQQEIEDVKHSLDIP